MLAAKIASKNAGAHGEPVHLPSGRQKVVCALSNATHLAGEQRLPLVGFPRSYHGLSRRGKGDGSVSRARMAVQSVRGLIEAC